MNSYFVDNRYLAVIIASTVMNISIHICRKLIAMCVLVSADKSRCKMQFKHHMFAVNKSQPVMSAARASRQEVGSISVTSVSMTSKHAKSKSEQSYALCIINDVLNILLLWLVFVDLHIKV